LLAAGRADALGWSPYTEWYENSMRFPDSPVARHHRETYGSKPYRDFARDWEAGLATWDPDDWARRFAAAGARYVVFVTKHHDGYCLWPSEVRNPHVRNWECRRDVVGELAEAVRSMGMRFGVYYSGGLDWTWNSHPIGRVTDLAVAQPRGDYVGYAEAHVRELIRRYRPSVLWNDISWPAPATKLAPLLGEYYASVPDGVVNDRFLTWSPAFAAAKAAPVRKLIDAAVSKTANKDRGIIPPKPAMFDVRTPEYTVFDDIQRDSWECVRGIDKSFGHNEYSDESHFLSRRDLLWSVADIASKNGNLLLNVGPRGRDAAIAPAQQRRLEWLAEFRPTLDGALRSTRPWTTPEDHGDGYEVRYAARGREVRALVRAIDPGSAMSEVTLAAVAATPTTEVSSPTGDPLAWAPTSGGLRVDLSVPAVDEVPTAIVLRDVVAAPRR
jgi:alpha-L-fucosidase